MPLASDDRRELAAYCIWYNRAPFRRAVTEGLRAVWTNTEESYELCGADTRRFEPLLHIGPSMVLALVGGVWSPGDLGGFLKARELLPEGCEVMALRLDSEWYIPHHGLKDESRRDEFAQWKGQLREYWLVRR
jgi:hypothetical protein